MKQLLLTLLILASGNVLYSQTYMSNSHMAWSVDSNNNPVKLLGTTNEKDVFHIAEKQITWHNFNRNSTNYYMIKSKKTDGKGTLYETKCKLDGHRYAFILSDKKLLVKDRDAISFNDCVLWYTLE